MQDLYLQLQNLKRTDKYCLIFIGFISAIAKFKTY